MPLSRHKRSNCFSFRKAHAARIYSASKAFVDAVVMLEWEMRTLENEWWHFFNIFWQAWGSWRLLWCIFWYSLELLYHIEIAPYNHEENSRAQRCQAWIPTNLCWYIIWSLDLFSNLNSWFMCKYIPIYLALNLRAVFEVYTFQARVATTSIGMKRYERMLYYRVLTGYPLSQIAQLAGAIVLPLPSGAKRTKKPPQIDGMR